MPTEDIDPTNQAQDVPKEKTNRAYSIQSLSKEREAGLTKERGSSSLKSFVEESDEPPTRARKYLNQCTSRFVSSRGGGAFLYRGRMHVIFFILVYAFLIHI